MKKPKWLNKRNVLQLVFSIFGGYMLSSITFYFSGVYLLPQKNIISAFYIGLMVVFTFIVSHKINQMDFSSLNKKTTPNNINMDWIK